MRFFAFVPRFFLGLGLLVLATCNSTSAIKSYSYTLPPTPGGRLCVNQCLEAKDYCRQNCELDQRRCLNKVQAQALQDYDKYTRDQFAAHLSIELRPRDFERDAPCDADNNGCLDDCEGHYQVCYGDCGGTVSITSSCQFLCF